MKKKIKEKINEAVNTKIFLIVIGLSLFIKTIFFYRNTIMLNVQASRETGIGTVMFIITLMFMISSFSNKKRTIIAITIDFIISTILCADNLYYVYSNNVLSIAQITNLQYGEEIISTLPLLLDFKFIVYFLDLILIALLKIFKIIEIKTEPKKDKKKIIISIAIFSISLLCWILFSRNSIEQAKGHSYNKDEQIALSTIFGYHISDIENSFNYKKQTKYQKYEDMEEKYEKLKTEYKEEYGEDNYNIQGILKDKNIIILQLESMQDFVINKNINGKEITPNLNKFFSENVRFANMNMQSYSSTADSEYSSITSTYPMENGMSFSRYFSNTYDNLFNIYNKANYNTSYMHGNVSTFWNRGNAYGNFNLNTLFFIDSFENTNEKISGYLSDELLYRQAVDKLKKIENPYITYIVAASSHTPFTLEGIENKEEKINIDVGKYKDTFFGNYLEAMNYADYAFGIFINQLKEKGLYDETAILVFGDHNGLIMYDENLVDFLIQDNHNINDVDIRLNYTKVLSGIKIPGLDKNLVITKPVSKLDIKPTLTYLSGLEDGFSLGTNMFESKDFICLNNGRIITDKYYYDEEWFSISTGEKVNLENIDEEEKKKLNKYYNYMKSELDISFSINVNNLLEKR